MEDQWRLTKVQFDPVEAGFTNEPNAISAKESEPMKLADKFAELFAKDAISEAIETNCSLTISRFDIAKILKSKQFTLRATSSNL